MSAPPSSYLGANQSLLRNFFTGIGHAVLGRSEKWNFGRNYWPVNQKIILVDVSYNELMLVAQNVPHLNVVITRGAEMFSNMEIKHLDSKGVEIPFAKSDVLKLIDQPNPLQSMEAFLYDFYVYNAIYSANFGFKNKGSKLSALPTTMWWLPPGWVKVQTTGKIYRQLSISDIIESYTLLYEPVPFKPEEIIHMTEGISMQKVGQGSRIESLQLPLSNIMAALKSNNIILTERGLIGFISKSDDKDINGSMPMSDKERQRIEDQYQNDRSLDSKNSHVLVSGISLKWQPMTFDVKQLMLYEGLEDAFGQICAAYGIDRDVFPSTKGATNENKEMGLKSTVQNTMQTLANKLMRQLSRHLGLTEKGERLVASYAHMPVMKEDAQAAATAKYQECQAYSLMLKDRVISREQYADLAEVDFDGDEEPLPEPPPAPAPPIPPAK